MSAINKFATMALLSLLAFAACSTEDDDVCQTENMSFSEDIFPIIESNCFTDCHNGSAPTSGFTLENYADVKVKVDQGRLVGAVTRQPGFVAMPYNLGPLPSCEKDQIAAWVAQGALDN